MANTKIRATAELFLDTSNASSDAKQFVADIKKRLSEVETAVDKMTAFKDLVGYIAQIDQNLAALKAKNGDAFAHMFDGMDENFRAEFEKIFKINKDKLEELNKLRENINNATQADKDNGNLSKWEKQLKDIYALMDAKADITGRGSFELRIQRMKDALDGFATVWQDVMGRVAQGFQFGGTGGGSGSGTISAELQNEIDKLKKLKDEYLQILDLFDGKKISIKIDKKNDAKTLKSLIDEYQKITKEYNSLSRSGGSQEDLDRKMAERLRVATLLADVVKKVEKSGSVSAIDVWGKEYTTSLKDELTAFLNDKTYTKYAARIKTIFSSMIADIDSQITDLQKPKSGHKEGGGASTSSASDATGYTKEQYEELLKVVKAVEDAIKAQTEALSGEGKAMDDAVKQSIESINNLKTALAEVKQDIDNLWKQPQDQPIDILNTGKIKEQMDEAISIVRESVEKIRAELQSLKEVNVEIGGVDNPELQQPKESVEESVKKLLATVYHGSKVALHDVDYDLSKGRGMRNLGEGMYFTPDMKKASQYGQNILTQSLDMDKIFILTEDFVTNIDDLYNIMGKVKPENVDWATIKSNLLSWMKESPANPRKFAEQMQAKGYHGVYSKGYGFADPSVEQMVLYDEQYKKGLKTTLYKDMQSSAEATLETQQAITAEIEKQKNASQAVAAQEQKREAAASEELATQQKITQETATPETASIHRENAEAKREEAEATRELAAAEAETKKSYDNSDLIDLIYNKDKLQQELKDNTNLTETLTGEKDEIKARMRPVEEAVSRISKMASLKGVKYDDYYQEAANVAQRLSTMYDEGITNTEEYIALQYKLMKIFDAVSKSAGGVKGADAKNAAQLRSWIMKSIKQDTGFDIQQSSAIDAIWGQGDYSIFDDSGKKRNMREIAAELLKYQGTEYSDGLGFEADVRRIEYIQEVLESINNLAPDGLKEQLAIINQIISAYNELGDAESDGTEAQEEKAREKVQALEEQYYSVIATMKNGEKITIPLDENDFNESAEKILQNAKEIQNIEFVPRSAEGAIQAYEGIDRVIANISRHCKDLDRVDKAVGAFNLDTKYPEYLQKHIQQIEANDPTFKYGSKDSYDQAVKLVGKFKQLFERTKLEDSFSDEINQLEELGKFEWNDDINKGFHNILKNIREGTYTTVEECIAKFKELIASANNVDEQIEVVEKPDTQTDAMKEPSPIDTAETSSHVQLEQAVRNVTSAVEAKTAAFREEAITVGQVVGQETLALQELEIYLRTISELAQSLFNNSFVSNNVFETWKSDLSVIEVSIKAIVESISSMPMLSDKLDMQNVNTDNSEKPEVPNIDLTDIASSMKQELGQIRTVLQSFTGIEAPNENAVEQKKPKAEVEGSKPDKTWFDGLATEDTLLSVREAVNRLADVLKAKDDDERQDIITKLSESINGAVTELKHVASGIVQHQKVQGTSTQAASDKLLTKENYDRVRETALKAVSDVTFGGNSGIMTMEALEDGLIQVTGWVQTAENAWSQFTVRVNEAGEASKALIKENSQAAKRAAEEAQTIQSSIDVDEKSKPVTPQQTTGDQDGVLETARRLDEYKKRAKDLFKGLDFGVTTAQTDAQQKIVDIYDKILNMSEGLKKDHAVFEESDSRAQEIESLIRNLETEASQYKRDTLDIPSAIDSQLSDFKEFKNNIKHIGLLTDDLTERLSKMRAELKNIQTPEEFETWMSNWEQLKSDINAQQSSKATKERLGSIQDSLSQRKTELSKSASKLGFDIYDENLTGDQLVIAQEYKEAINLIELYRKSAGSLSQDEIANAFRVADAIQNKMSAYKSAAAAQEQLNKQADEQRTFADKKDKQILSFDKYKTSITSSITLTQELSDELASLESRLNNISSVDALSAWQKDFAQFENKVHAYKNDDTYKTADKQSKEQLNAIKNALEADLKKFKTAVGDTPDADQQKLIDDHETLISLIKERQALSRMATNDELNAFEQEHKLLSENLKLYKEQHNITETKIKKKPYGTGTMAGAIGKDNNLKKLIVDSNLIEASQTEGNALNAALEEYKNSYAELERIYNRLKTVEAPTLQDEAEFKAASAACNQHRKSIEDLVKAREKLYENNTNVKSLDDPSTKNTEEGRKKALTDYVEEMHGAKAKIDAFNDSCNEIEFTIRNSDGTFTKAKASIDALGNAIVESANKTHAATAQFGTIGDVVKELGQELAQFAATRFGIEEIIQMISQGVNSVKELDLAMTELKKVTNETDATYDSFLGKASKTAGNIGTTLTEFVSSTADFARLGYDISEAASLAEAASIYSNIGDGVDDIEQGTNSIISTMQAFGIEASSAMSIVDKFNEIGNKFAITSGGIGDALQVSASALYSAGNTIDESIALITTANSVVQNPNVVGTAMKTLSLRLRGAKVELEEAGLETDAMAESTATLQAKLQALTHGKVDIMLDPDTFKSTTQILREMAAAWEDMTDIERASALELMGGKRQANVLSALITNWDMAEKAIQESVDSQGSAVAENEKYMDSIQGRIDQFNNATQTMWANFISDDLIKWIVGLGTKFVQTLDSMGSAWTIFVGLLVSAPIMTAFKAFNLWANDAQNTMSLFDYMKTGVGGLIESFKNIGPAIKTAGSAITTFISSNWKLVAVMAAIAAAATVWDIVTTSAKEAAEAAEEAMSKYNEAQSKLANMDSTINDVADDYSRLAMGVDEFGNNISLTTSEYERYNEIVNQIASMFPEMVRGYTEEGNAIIKNKGSVEALTAAYKALEEQANNTLLTSASDIMTNYHKTVDGGFWGTDSSDNIEAANMLKEAMENQDTWDFSQVYDTNMAQLLKDAGIEKSVWEDEKQFVQRAIKEFPGVVQSIINSWDAIVNSAVSNVRPLIDAYLSQSDGYESLTNNQRKVFDSIVSSFDESFLNQFEGDATKMYQTIENMILNLKSSGLDGEYTFVLNTKTKLNNNEMTVGEYQKQVQDFVDQVNKSDVLDDNSKTYIRMSLGFGEDGKSDIDTQIASAQKRVDEALRDKILTLNYSDLQIVNSDEFNVDGSTISTWKQLRAEIQLTKNAITKDFTTDNFADYSENIKSITSNITAYQEALENLESGTFTMTDFMELIEQFPDLAKGVDISSKSFDGLSDNLRHAIKNAPDALIDSLKDLKQQLDAAGKSTDEIDKLITSLENLPTDSVDSLANHFSTLSDEMSEAKRAMNELKEAMSQNPNEGFETRGSAIEQMKTLMEQGAVGSESEIWDIAKAFFGDNPNAFEAIANKDAAALYKLIDARDEWYATDKDGKHTFDGTKNFLNDVTEATKNKDVQDKLKELGFDWQFDGTNLKFDFDNENWDAIVETLASTSDLAGLTSEEFADLLVQVGQFFNIEWGDANDVSSYIETIGNSSRSASEKLSLMTNVVENFAEQELGQDLDMSSLTEADVDALKCDESLKQLLKTYISLRREFEDPLGIETTLDGKKGLSELAGLGSMQGIVTQNKDGTTVVDTEAFTKAAKEAGYTDEKIKQLIETIQSYENVISVTTSDPLGLKNTNASLDTVKSTLESLGVAFSEVPDGETGGITLDVNAPDLIETLKSKGWTQEKISTYLQTLTSSETGLPIKLGDVELSKEGIDTAVQEAFAKDLEVTMNPQTQAIDDYCDAGKEMEVVLKPNTSELDALGITTPSEGGDGTGAGEGGGQSKTKGLIEGRTESPLDGNTTGASDLEMMAFSVKAAEIISQATQELDARQKMMEAAQHYNEHTNGNFDYTKAYHATPEEMRKHYPEFDGPVATTYDAGYTIADSNGTDYSIVVSCITPDGEILDANSLESYVNNVLAGSNNILEADKPENGGKGLVINAEEGKWNGQQFEAFNNILKGYKDQEAQFYQMLHGGFDENGSGAGEVTIQPENVVIEPASTYSAMGQAFGSNQQQPASTYGAASQGGVTTTQDQGGNQNFFEQAVDVVGDIFGDAGEALVSLFKPAVASADELTDEGQTGGELTLQPESVVVQSGAGYGNQPQGTTPPDPQVLNDIFRQVALDNMAGKTVDQVVEDKKTKEAEKQALIEQYKAAKEFQQTITDTLEQQYGQDPNDDNYKAWQDFQSRVLNGNAQNGEQNVVVQTKSVTVTTDGKGGNTGAGTNTGNGATGVGTTDTGTTTYGKQTIDGSNDYTWMSNDEFAKAIKGDRGWFEKYAYGIEGGMALTEQQKGIADYLMPKDMKKELSESLANWEPQTVNLQAEGVSLEGETPTTDNSNPPRTGGGGETRGGGTGGESFETPEPIGFETGDTDGAIEDIETLHQASVDAANSVQSMWQEYANNQESIDALDLFADKSTVLTQPEVEAYGLEVDESGFITVEQALTQLQEKQAALQTNIPIQVTLLSTTIDQEINALKQKIQQINDNPEIEPEVKEAQVEDLEAQIATLEETQVLITSLIDGDNTEAMSAIGEVKKETIPDKSFTVTAHNIDTIEDTLQNICDYLDRINEGASGNVNLTTSGPVGANGTAHAQGTAFKSGSWGAQNTETALVGELGPELLVRGNRWTTIGENGAEFRNIRKGDIIFNHKQTEDLLSKGYISGRGRAYAEGTAFASGNGSYKTYSFSDTKSSSSKNLEKAAKGISKSIDDASDDFEEIFDWIAVRIEEVTERIDLASAQLENAIGHSNQNNIIDDLIEYNKLLYQNLIAGAKEYNAFAEELLKKVPKKYREKAQDGAIDIEYFKGKVGDQAYSAIEKYREWVQKAAEVTQQAEETLTEISTLAKQAIDNIASDFENKKSIRDNKIDQLDAYNSLTETTLGAESVEIYKSLIKENNASISMLADQRDAMQEELNKRVEAGEIKKYSQDWYDAINDIAAIDTEIIELTADVADFQDAINELHWDHFDNLISRLEAVSNESDNLIDVLNSKDLFDKDTYEWTDEGITTLGLYAQKLEHAEMQSKKYEEEIKYLNENWQELGYTEQEYLDKLDDLKDGQYDAIKSYNDTKDAIKDLTAERVEAIKEGIQEEIDAYTELINKKKEELSAEKDLHDFQKGVADQQKEIADIERKLAALSADNSASARAQRAKLEAELAKARQDLQDTYYDRSIQDQQTALDKELENFQEEKEKEIEGWDEYLEETEKIVSDTLDVVQANTQTVYNTLQEMGKEYSLSIAEAITSPWKQGEYAIQNYSEQFGLAMSATVEELRKIAAEYKNFIAEIEGYGKEVTGTVNNNAQRYQSGDANNSSNSSVNNQEKESAIKVGGKIDAGNAKIYSYAGDKSGDTQYHSKDPIYTVLAVNGSWVQVRHHKQSNGVTGWFKKNQIKAYAKGTKAMDKDQFALIDELGEELVIRPSNGRMAFFEKGTGVVPANLTENLMEWGELDPSAMLSQNKPEISMSPSVVNNNMELHIDASVGELIHVDQLNGNNITEVTKIVDKAWNKYMKELNANIRRYANR